MYELEERQHQSKAPIQLKPDFASTQQRKAPTNPYSGRPLNISGGLAGKIKDSFGIDSTQLSLRESPDVESMGARATAQGNVIRFAPNQFRPQTNEGMQVLGHELNHVREQASGKVHATGGSIFQHSGHEAASDSAGAAFARGSLSSASPVSVAGMSAGAAPVQMMSWGWGKDRIIDLKRKREKSTLFASATTREAAQKKEEIRKLELIDIMEDLHLTGSFKVGGGTGEKLVEQKVESAFDGFLKDLAISAVGLVGDQISGVLDLNGFDTASAVVSGVTSAATGGYESFEAWKTRQEESADDPQSRFDNQARKKQAQSKNKLNTMNVITKTTGTGANVLSAIPLSSNEKKADEISGGLGTTAKGLSIIEHIGSINDSRHEIHNSKADAATAIATQDLVARKKDNIDEKSKDNEHLIENQNKLIQHEKNEKALAELKEKLVHIKEEGAGLKVKLVANLRHTNALAMGKDRANHDIREAGFEMAKDVVGIASDALGIAATWAPALQGTGVGMALSGASFAAQTLLELGKRIMHRNKDGNDDKDRISFELGIINMDKPNEPQTYKELKNVIYAKVEARRKENLDRSDDKVTHYTHDEIKEVMGMQMAGLSGGSKALKATLVANTTKQLLEEAQSSDAEESADAIEVFAGLGLDVSTMTNLPADLPSQFKIAQQLGYRGTEAQLGELITKGSGFDIRTARTAEQRKTADDKIRAEKAAKQKVPATAPTPVPVPEKKKEDDLKERMAKMSAGALQGRNGQTKEDTRATADVNAKSVELAAKKVQNKKKPTSK